MTKQILGAAIISGVLLTGSIAFAESATSTHATTPKPVDPAKIQCVGAAVAAREQAVGTAANTFTSAVTAAYSARATALQQAYTKTTSSDVRSAVKAAWGAFTKSVRDARKAWRAARDGAWTTYRKAAVACKAPGGLGDGGNSGSEMSGF